MTQVESPTALVWILGRVYCAGTPEDYEAVHELQDRFSSVPLSAYGQPYTPPPGVVDETFDMEKAVRKQVNDLPLDEFFGYLAELLKTNPPKPEDAPIVERMAEIGIVPGAGLRPQQAAEAGAQARSEAGAAGVGPRHEGQGARQWLALLDQRRRRVRNGLRAAGDGHADRAGFELPEDAVYPFSEKDADGKKYDGSKHRYVMRFEKGQMPPVKGFWSLTMYDPDFFFVPNPINRYSLSQRDTFVTNADGSVDLYLQAESPGADKEANWLPAPKGKFIPMLRLYWPQDTPPSILDGSWTPPPVRRAP